MELTTKMDAGEVHTLMPSELYDLHALLKEQDLLSIVFYDGSCCDASDFIELALSNDVAFFCSYDGDKPAIIWWLTDFSGRSAKMNFTMLRDYFDRRIDIGKYVCDICLKPNSNGVAYLDALYGLTPKPNRGAVRLGLELGFVKVAELPAVCEFRGRIVSGILTLNQYKE